MQLPPDKRAEKYVPAQFKSTAALDKSATPPCIRATAEGTETYQYEALKRQQIRKEVTILSYDTPTFRRITKEVPVFSPTQNFFESEAGFGLTKWVGVFPIVRWTDWEKVFIPSKWVGLFPLGAKLAQNGSHPLRDISNGDGRVDCPVFPCTFSDEEGYALFYTITYPIAIFAVDPKHTAQAVMAPIALCLNPIIDVVAYSLDVTAMALAGSAEAVCGILLPTGDVTAMTTAVALDTSLASVVIASDTAFTSLSLTGDSLMWMGDAVYPSDVTSVTNESPPEAYGEWEKMTGSSRPPDWTTYKMRFECGENVRECPIGVSGSVAVPLRDVRPKDSSVNPLRDITVTLCDKEGNAVGKPETVKVNFDEF